MQSRDFATFFQGRARLCLLRAIDLALEEDGQDLTSTGLFPPSDFLEAVIVAKESCIVAGLPLAGIVLERCAAGFAPGAPYTVMQLVREGARVSPGQELVRIQGQASLLLKAERVILNFLTHLSGIASLTNSYVEALRGSRTRLLDTRKTLPGLRHAEKYAVLLGGGVNHRLDLEEMLMLKDNHIDRAGSIAKAVSLLRKAHAPCPPIEVECRCMDEVRQAVRAGVERIMLDNMTPDEMRAALAAIPAEIETEISGGVSLENIAELGAIGADYISVGRITHSAPSSDLSMRVAPLHIAVPEHTGLNRCRLDPSQGGCAENIERLREKLGDSLCIMAHHYQGDALVAQADMVGDSLELSRKVADVAARHIVFCGVYFMAESAAILAPPEQEVYIPEPGANCVMSEMAPAERVEAVLERLNSGSRTVMPVAYVNTAAAVKAVCGRFGGTVCTSANAGRILAWALERCDAVLFLPDKNLGLNTANALGIAEDERLVLDIRQQGRLATPDLAEGRRLLLWPGCCAIHHGFKVSQIEAMRARHPDALVVVHPECPPSVVDSADSAGSTSHIIRYVADAPEGATIVVGTEVNLVHRLARQYAGSKTVLPLAEIACSNMAKVTEAKLEALLQGLAEGQATLPPVRVGREIAEPARLALERMLQASA